MTSEARSIEVGQTLDKYELVERVGQGGMAVVYRARDNVLRRDVALKILHNHLADYQEARDRFQREAHAVAKLRHDNILEIFDYSGGAAASYIVTEFIDGQTLKQFISAHPIAFPEIGAMIVLQVGRALAHAHGAGILHRDVKPENVMIRRDGVVKLTDFGISHMVDLERLTITGQLLGSPAYMAPEHVEGRPIDYRTDVFAAGIVLYQLAVGRLPFEGKNPHEVLKRIAECSFVPARKANPKIGNQLGRIMDRAMAREPADRFQAMEEMVAALETYLRDCGLDQPAAELARYFQDPTAYEFELRQRLIEQLTRRGKSLLVSQRAAALDAFDRVLTLDPKNLEVLGALDKVALRRQLWRAAAATAAVAAIGGGYLAVAHALAAEPTHAAPPVAPLHVPTKDAALAVAYEPPPPADARLAEPSDDALDDAMAPPVDHTTAPPPERVQPRPEPRVPREVDEPSQPLAPVTLVVSPANSEVRLGDGPWQRVGQRLTVPMSGPELRVTVRNDSCCEAQSRTLRADDAGTRVVISLDFLAAQIVPRCPNTEVEVRVDGKLARLDSPASIPFGATTRTQRTVVVEFLGDRIDRRQVTVHPAEQREVACAL